MKELDFGLELLNIFERMPAEYLMNDIKINSEYKLRILSIRYCRECSLMTTDNKVIGRLTLEPKLHGSFTQKESDEDLYIFMKVFYNIIKNNQHEIFLDELRIELI
jgi:hypothetical protein